MHKFKDDPYFAQYSSFHKTVKENVAVFPNGILSTGGDCSRFFIQLDFYTWIKKYGISSPSNCFTTWPMDPEMRMLSCGHVTEYVYNDKDGSNDLHHIPPTVPRGLADFVVVSQTLEHLWNPFRALINLNRILRPGGYIFTSAPTVNMPHMTPHHFLHFQPMGLAMLFVDAGFEVIEMGQYGSFLYQKTILETGITIWPRCDSLLDTSGNILNDRDHVAQVWILARKPL